MNPTSVPNHHAVFDGERCCTSARNSDTDCRAILYRRNFKSEISDFESNLDCINKSIHGVV